MSAGHTLARYVVPGRALAPTRHLLVRGLASIGSAVTAGDAGAALPVALGLDVSDACNLACRVCSREVDRDARRRPFLPRADARRILEEVRPGYVSLSGYGETMLHRDLAGIVADAVALGAQVNVVSNGTLLDAARAEGLIDAGLARLKVSLDAATPEAYARVREGGEIEPVLRNVEALQARVRARGRGPRVEVQMVAFRENLAELLPMLALCDERLGVDLNVMGMFTYGGQEAFTERALEDVPATRAALQRAREDAARRGMWRARASLGAAIAALSGEASRKPCLVPWYSAIVSTDGDLYPCCHHTIRGTCVGNVLRDGFSAVWNGPAMRDFRAGLRANRCGDRVCATCPEHDAGLAGVRRLVLLGRGGGAAPSP